MNNIRLKNISNHRQVVRIRHDDSFHVEAGSFFHVDAETAKRLLRDAEIFALWEPSPAQRAAGKCTGGSPDALQQLGLELAEGAVPMRKRMKTKPALEHATKGIETETEEIDPA